MEWISSSSSLVLDTKCLFIFFGLVYYGYIVCMCQWAKLREKKKNKNTHRIVRCWNKCTQFHEPWAMSHDHAIHYYCFNAKIIAATMFSRILMCVLYIYSWIEHHASPQNSRNSPTTGLTSTLKWSTCTHTRTLQPHKYALTIKIRSF